MKSLVFSLTLLVSGVCNAQYSKQNLKLESNTSSKYRYEKLQLYPIRANASFAADHKNVGSYETLKNALDKRKVVIREANDGEVNTLQIENTSRDTVMILSGEVVQGGKQDRMVAQDVILYPKSKKNLAVYCVEHGRWRPKDSGMEFKKYYTISSNEIRKAAVVKKDQQEVWNKVAETTEKNKANTSTGTLTALKESGEFDNELKKYVDYFERLIANENDVIGVVAVSGNSVLGCDMFATHELLKEHYHNLVNSYATEAITTGTNVQISYDQVSQYLDKIILDEQKQDSEIQKKGTMLKDGKKKLHISTF